MEKLNDYYMSWRFARSVAGIRMSETGSGGSCNTPVPHSVLCWCVNPQNKDVEGNTAAHIAIAAYATKPLSAERHLSIYCTVRTYLSGRKKVEKNVFPVYSVATGTASEN